MTRIATIISYLLFLTLFSSSKKEPNYNKKANEVVKQFILDESCGCIFEIPKESMIEKISKEDPRRNIRKILIEKLRLNDRKELDSLENLAENFILDATFMKQNKIKILALDSEKKIVIDPNYCKDGILSIRKPIFNKDYTTAVIDYGYSYVCITPPLAIYIFENGKWKRQN